MQVAGIAIGRGGKAPKGEISPCWALGRLLRPWREVILLCCLLTAVEVPPGHSDTPPVRILPGETLVIGVGSLLSAADSPSGGTILAGVEAYLEDHPSLMDHPVKLVIVEDGCDETLTVKRAEEFCAMLPRPLAVIGYFCSPGSVASARLHRACGLPLINVTSSDPALTRAGEPWALRVWTSRDRQGLLLGQWIRPRSLRRMLVIHETDTVSVAIVDAFQREVAGFTPRPRVQTLAATPLAGDPRALFQDKEPPQLVYYVGEGWDLGELWKRLPETAMAIPWVLDGRVELMTAGETPARHPRELHRILLTLPAGDPEAPQRQFFRGRFGEPGVYALVAYDAVAILMEAFRQAAKQDRGGTSWEPHVLVKALRETSVHGLTGLITFDAWGDRVQASATLYRWREGRWEAHWEGKVP